MADVFIGIGSNLGDRKNNLEKAIKIIKKTEGIIFEKRSSFVESKPQNASGPDYLNGAIKIKTELKPKELLIRLQKIENELGRRRPFKNSPRKIDLDILFYGKLKIKSKDLTIPHPRIKERDFVKKPLLEIEPNFKLTLDDRNQKN